MGLCSAIHKKTFQHQTFNEWVRRVSGLGLGSGPKTQTQTQISKKFQTQTQTQTQIPQKTWVQTQTQTQIPKKIGSRPKLRPKFYGAKLT